MSSSEGLYRTTLCRCLVHRRHYSAANAFRVSPSECFFSDTPPKCLLEIAWEDAVRGIGMAMSTVASEKNRELLFIGNVFYKQ